MIADRNTFKPEYLIAQALKGKGTGSGCATCNQSSNIPSPSTPKVAPKTVQPIVADAVVPISVGVILNELPIISKDGIVAEKFQVFTDELKIFAPKIEMTQPLVLKQLEVIAPVKVTETITATPVKISDIAKQIKKEIAKVSKTKRAYKKRKK
jgi:hypothetical protein